jgi:hypothetical protein
VADSFVVDVAIGGGLVASYFDLSSINVRSGQTLREGSIVGSVRPAGDPRNQVGLHVALTHSQHYNEFRRMRQAGAIGFPRPPIRTPPSGPSAPSITTLSVSGSFPQDPPPQIPKDENDRIVLAVLLGEASTPGEDSWGPDEYGPRAYRNPTRKLSDDDVYGEMSYMVSVINNRLIDWGKTENYKSWKDVVEKSPDFLGYANGLNILKTLGSGGAQDQRARLAIAAIRDFHAAPFGHDPARSIYHFWKSIKQPGKGGRTFITKKGNAFRLANTDFHVNLSRY